MQIPIMLTNELVDVLERQGISPEDYQPAYGGESIGLDLYYTGGKPLVIDGNEKKIFRNLDALFKGSARCESKVLIPTGVHIVLPKGYVASIRDRGSISKTDFIRRAGEIDPGYTGEIFVNLYAIKPTVIEPGQKLPVQLIVKKAETNYHVISKEEFQALTATAERGRGKTGSSDSTTSQENI